LTVGEEIDGLEPKSFQEAIKGAEGQ